MNLATTLTGGKHGGKWIGSVLGVLSTIAAVDPQAVPSSWLPYLGIAGAVAYLVRSFVNTSNLDAKPPEKP